MAQYLFALFDWMVTLSMILTIGNFVKVISCFVDQSIKELLVHPVSLNSTTPIIMCGFKNDTRHYYLHVPTRRRLLYLELLVRLSSC